MTIVTARLNKDYRVLIKEAMLATMGVNGVSNPKKKGELLLKPLTDKTFKSLLVGRHSPIKRGRIYVEAYVPDRVMTHLTRHHEGLYFVATSRPDIKYHTELTEGMRYLSFEMDFKRLIEVMQLRLCTKSWGETREFFGEIRDLIYDMDKTLHSVLHPSCIWAGGNCTEVGPCGYNETPSGKDALKVMWEDHK